MRLFSAFIILLLLFPLNVSAKIYMFVDGEGIKHFVDSYEAIPEKYREKKVQTISSGDEERKGGVKKAEEEKPEESVSQDSKKESKDLPETEKKKTEADIIKEWDEKLSKCKEKIETAKKRFGEADRFKDRTTSSYSRKQYSNADRKAGEDEYDAAKKDYEDAQKELDDIEESAKREAPSSWWRENFY